MFYEYNNLVIFFIISVVMSMLLVFLSDAFIAMHPDSDKASVYECGFQPFDLNLQQFDVKYYLVALMFLMFDVEMIFVMPFVSNIYLLSFYMFSMFILFFLMLMFGLLYEWKKKYLEWE